MQTMARKPPKSGSRDSGRCVSYIVIDDDSAAASSSSSEDGRGTEELHSHSGEMNHLSAEEQNCDFSDSDSDDAMWPRCDVDASGYLPVSGRIAQPGWSCRVGTDDTAMLMFDNHQLPLFEACDVCDEQHDLLTTEPTLNHGAQQHQDGGSVGLRIQCCANDQLGIKKTTITSRGLGVVKTTIESPSLGLVETTVQLDGCPLVKTTLDCRDLDLTETRIYNKELGLVKTTLHSGRQGQKHKSPVVEGTSTKDPQSLQQARVRNADNYAAYRDMPTYEQRKGTVCQSWTRTTADRRGPTNDADGLPNVIEGSHGCAAATVSTRLRLVNKQRQSNSAEEQDRSCKYRKETHYIPDEGRYTSPYQGKQRERSDIPHICRPKTSHEVGKHQTVEDQRPTSLHGYNTASSLHDTAAVQSNDVSSASSDDDMIIIDSLSSDDVTYDEGANETKVVADAERRDDNEMITVCCDNAITTYSSVSGLNTSLAEITSDLNYGPEYMQTSSQESPNDADKEGVMQPQQQQETESDGAVSVEQLQTTETNQFAEAKLLQQGTGISDTAGLSLSEIGNEFGPRILLKPCQVLLKRLESDSVSSLLHQSFACARSDNNAKATDTTEIASQQYITAIKYGSVRASNTIKASNGLPKDQSSCESKLPNHTEVPTTSQESLLNERIRDDMKPHCGPTTASHEEQPQQTGREQIVNKSPKPISLKDKFSKCRKILGVVKCPRKKTNTTQQLNEESKVTDAGNETLNATRSQLEIDSKSDKSGQEEIMPSPNKRSVIRPGYGTAVREQRRKTRNKSSERGDFSKAVDLETRLHDEVDTRERQALTTATQLFQTASCCNGSAPRPLKPSYIVETAKKQLRLAGGFWSFTKRGSLIQKSNCKKPLEVAKTSQPQTAEYRDVYSFENSDEINNIVELKQPRNSKFARKRRNSQPVKAKELSNKKSKVKAAAGAQKNTSWEVASWEARNLQSTQSVDVEVEGETTLAPFTSEAGLEAIDFHEDNISGLNSSTVDESCETGTDCDSVNTRAPLIVRLRKQAPLSYAASETTSATRQRGDAMRQIIAEIRRVHRRLDFVLLQRRRRRHSNASHTWTAHCKRNLTASADPDVNSEFPNDNISHAERFRDECGDPEPVGKGSKLAATVASWPMHLYVKPQVLYDDSEAVELLLCAAERRPLDINRLLACITSSATFLLVLPGLFTCQTQLLMLEAKLAGDVTRTSATAVPTVNALKLKRKGRRSKHQRQRSLPASEEPGTRKRADMTDSDTGRSGHITKDDTDSSIAAETNISHLCTVEDSGVPEKTTLQFVWTTEDVACTVDSRLDSAGPTVTTENRKMSDERGQLHETASVAVHSDCQVSVGESVMTVACDQSKVSDQRPKSVGVRHKHRESTPHRPPWLRQTTPQLDDRHTPLDCTQRTTPAVVMPTHPIHARHYPPPYPSPAIQPVAYPPRSCAVPRDPGLSRVLPNLSLFDTELDLSECELASQCGDVDVAVDELMTTVPSYPCSASTHPVPWCYDTAANSAFMKPEPRHSYDVRLPPHPLHPYGPYHSQTFTPNNIGHRLYRPRPRICNVWAFDSDVSAVPTSYYNSWSPYQHYRYHHPYQR